MLRPWMQHVDRFCHQYLQLEKELDYPPDEALRPAEAQAAIYSRLFADDALAADGPPHRYRARALKALVTRIEAAIDDWDEHAVSDDLMAALAALLAAPLAPEAASARDRCRVRHHVSLLRRGDGTAGWDEPGITLLESPWLISAAGTTGLRTWEAALHLGQYLCLHPHTVAGKRVLELGAGTGYVSILCAKYLSCAHAVVSDGSDEVVGNLADNFALNGVDGSPRRLSAQKLQWGDAPAGAQAVEVVLGADVIYDQAVIPALVETMVRVLEASAGAEVYMAATQRNERTFAAFLDACRDGGLDVGHLDFAVPARGQQRGPFYSDEVAIRICRCRLSRRPREGEEGGGRPASHAAAASLS